MEEWQSLAPEFPQYSVSSHGRVINDETRRFIAQSKNQQGYMKVSLYDIDGDRKTMTVTRLVALAFLPGQTDVFDTPIHLNGNKEHTFVDNLAWRPRWFAAKYHQQFGDRQWHVIVPIVELKTRRRFENSLEAVKAFGVLERDVTLSLHNHTEVFPTGHTFRFEA